MGTSHTSGPENRPILQGATEWANTLSERLTGLAATAEMVPLKNHISSLAKQVRDLGAALQQASPQISEWVQQICANNSGWEDLQTIVVRQDDVEFSRKLPEVLKNDADKHVTYLLRVYVEEMLLRYMAELLPAESANAIKYEIRRSNNQTSQDVANDLILGGVNQTLLKLGDSLGKGLAIIVDGSHIRRPTQHEQLATNVSLAITQAIREPATRILTLVHDGLLFQRMLAPLANQQDYAPILGRDHGAASKFVSKQHVLLEWEGACLLAKEPARRPTNPGHVLSETEISVIPPEGVQLRAGDILCVGLVSTNPNDELLAPLVKVPAGRLLPPLLKTRQAVSTGARIESALWNLETGGCVAIGTSPGPDGIMIYGRAAELLDPIHMRIVRIGRIDEPEVEYSIIDGEGSGSLNGFTVDGENWDGRRIVKSGSMIELPSLPGVEPVRFKLP
ncbi:MAG: hypothetical protein K1X79_07965 [Oligoflexia bacterium]|nr:hypothetical protein [Oligoflexia bacterium]